MSQVVMVDQYFCFVFRVIKANMKYYRYPMLNIELMCKKILYIDFVCKKYELNATKFMHFVEQVNIPAFNVMIKTTKIHKNITLKYMNIYELTMLLI